MSTMPPLRRKTAPILKAGRRRKTARSLMMLLCAVPVAEPCLAQASSSQTSSSQTSPQNAPTQTSPIQKAPAPVPAPIPLKAPPPVAAPPASTPTPGMAKPVEAAPAAAVPTTKPEPAVKPAPKLIPKTGPGVNEAGEAATTVRTTKLPLISLIDRSVIGKDKREIGHVIDVLVDAKGEPSALVVDVGGFMGVGNRRIAIAWERFALAGRKSRDALQLQLSDAQVTAAPAYDGSEQVTVVQDAIEPPDASPGKGSLNSSRVDLGEGLTDSGSDQGGGADQVGATPADPLNPD